MAPRNPFKPTFGVTPPLLVGRDALIDEFVEALEDGPGAAGRATLYTGARGSGKTVMLNVVEGEAKQLGWLVISETASRGLVDRISKQHLPPLLRTFDPDAVKKRLTGITGPLQVGGLTWTAVEKHAAEAGLRNQISLLTDLLREHETGLLITLDEIHAGVIEELRELAVAIQHAFREERQLAFAGAGLKLAIADILNDEVLTFLRRSERHEIGTVGLDDVRRALKEPIVAHGRAVTDDALAEMAAGTHGYPFLIQLVGAQTWRVRATARDISLADARLGVANALRRLGSLVHEPALAGASDVDKTFLVAMSQDDGPSRMADIASRLGVDAGYASVYRARLIAAELVSPAMRGYVDFTLPYLREYLREHATADVPTESP